MDGFIVNIFTLFQIKHFHIRMATRQEIPNSIGTWLERDGDGIIDPLPCIRLYNNVFLVNMHF